MKKICRFHDPHRLMWIIESEDGLYDYISTEMNIVLYHIMDKHQFMCKDFEVEISRESIEDFDVVLKYQETSQSVLFYKWNDESFFITKNFGSYFNLFNEPNDLYIKYINDHM
jgi:hypothetical protein